jgi:putative protein-disulfide isomerase
MSPHIDQLQSETDIPVRVVMGGLHIGSNAPSMTDQRVNQLSTHWKKLAEMTDQPFDPSSLTADGRYDTHTASTAVVAMRELKPELAVEFLARCQRAFFSEGVDITQRQQVASLAAPFDIDPRGFEILLGTSDIEEATLADYAWAHSIGATSFPTVMFATDSWARAIAVGYTSVEDMLRHVEVARERIAGEQT